MDEKQETPKLIRDIRVFSDDRDLDSEIMGTSDFSNYYTVKFNAKQYANRFVCKLRELDFKVLGYNHIFIVFSPNIPPGKKLAKKDEYFLWKRETSFGLEANKWNALSKKEQISEFTKYLSDIVIFAGAPDQSGIVEKAANELRAFGRELLIKVFEKETKSYLVRVDLQIQPVSELSFAFITYFDKKARVKRRGKFLEFKSDNHIYILCSTITVKDNVLRIIPRKSWSGDQVAKQYKNKLNIPISSLHTID